ncbi:FAD-dependent oxidoreductase [Papillibacter cinnamivorans]|uniref:CoA-disulfide reductase n=1 Tax=Papillibacter cinnamivorans DSM 12816 TaxID=1122930 RepID=A0A1W2BUM5_9FIRM|nr:FAD-dependent oxidoreductase [Papillibacter cinnamivorans]SMC76426.1 CoA-disulfide reductase [Papillibacter cinnamivorans DSM 12816]
MSKILIVGGVAGGASAAARLRRLDEHSEIIMFERGEYISFANCGLPYYIGGEITDKEALTLQTPESFYDRFQVDVRVNQEVVSIDPKGKTVKVKNVKTGATYQESYDKMILSPGAEPVKPPIEGADNPRVFSLRNIPDTYRIREYIDQKSPKSAIVVGGGYIGVEMAENLANAGLEVTIVEFADHVIAPLDYDMACDVHNHLRQKGVELILKDGVKAISEDGEQLKIQLGNRAIRADMVLMSVGVRPESAIAKDAGLAVNPRGAIIVDEKMRTSDENIYAVGDAVEIRDVVTGEKGYIPLAGPANKQGRIAADNICGIESTYGGTLGTGILKCFDLTIATVGITEARAKALGLEYEKSFTYSSSHASYYPGAVNLSMKLIFGKDGKILGAQIVGFDGVDKRIDVIASAMRSGLTVFDLTRLELAYAPPFSSAKDPVNMAGFVAENILTGKVNVFHWNEVNDLPRDGSVTLLDVRTPLECETGVMDGFVNIPLDELRKHLDELDKSKPVYATCQIGLRGYVACRILTQHGFTCRNLSGGYRLYESIYNQAQPVKHETKINSETMRPLASTIQVNACGLQCPGPILKLSETMKNAENGAVIEIKTSDPAFTGDVEAWCRRTGNTFLGVSSEKGIFKAVIKKGGSAPCANYTANNKKNIIVFSGDLDKAIASFIIANTAASMGRKVSMFFTFWGLNILRRPEKVPVQKTFMGRMFGAMMPRGAGKLALSKLNMGGMGANMIRGVMKEKNVNSLEEMIQIALKNGVELVACSMSMDLMGIAQEELIDGVKIGGAASMLANAEESDMSLFI